MENKSSERDNALLARWALVHHERGSLVALNAIAFVLLVGMGYLYWRISGEEIIYSCPDIYRDRPVELHWRPRAP